MTTAPTPIHVLIADDHPLFRAGLRQAIEAQPGHWCVHEAANGEDVLLLCQSLHLDALILDITMPRLDGLETLRRLRELNLPVRTMLLIMHDDNELITEGMQLGVLAYVLKDDDITDCLRALHLVLEDKHYLSPALFNHFMHGRQGLEILKPAKPDLSQLTATEHKILALIAEDLTSKEIATRLRCSVHTINAHRQNLSTKLGLSGTHSLLKFAYDYRQNSVDHPAPVAAAHPPAKP